MSQFATAAEMRDLMEWTGTTGRKSTANLDLLLTWASDDLERRTGRVITASASNTLRTFTTNGRAYIVTPDFREVGAGGVLLQGAALTADSGYWPIPSRQDPDIFVGVQLRAFGTQSYLSNPEWFDRNLDQQYEKGYSSGSLPNDLQMYALWGHTSTPASWKLVTIALAGFGYQHFDALFSSARATPEGNIFDLSQYPIEVRSHIEEWRLGDEATVV